MENGKGCKLILFPNKKTLMDVAFNMKAIEMGEQTEKTGNISFQSEISTQRGSKLSSRSSNDQQFDPLLESSIRYSS